VKLARFRKTKVTCFLSYVGDRRNTNISIIICTYKYIQNMLPKMGLLETKGREKEEKNDKNE
jgi:hypothetical protein